MYSYTRISESVVREGMMHIRRGILTLSAVLMLVAMPDRGIRAHGEDGDHLDLLRQTSKAFSSVARKAMPAVVFIDVEKTITTGGYMSQGQLNDPFGFFGDEFYNRFFRGRGYPHGPQQFRQRGQGSGFLITRDGYILTNNHVVGDADEITVTLRGGKKYKAKRIGSDPRSEVAVVKIEGEDFPFLDLGDSDELEIGEWVIAVGSPFGLQETVTVGVVSAKGRSNVGIAEYENFIQTDAAINPGNSGGPLLNVEGKVVGINTAIVSQSGGYMGIGFAIPISMARIIKDQLVDNGRVVRGFLGVGLNLEDIDEALAESFGLERAGGVLVTRIVKDSPAEKAGLKEEDIILEVNGEPTKNNRSFRNRIALLPPGAEARLKIFRDGKTMTKNVTIGTFPEDTADAQKAEEVAAEIGLTVEDLTPEIAARFGYEEGEGILVTQVAPGTPAHEAGIQPGFLVLSVNRQPVTTVEEFRAALAPSLLTKRVLLRVRNNRYSWFVLLQLD